MIKNKHKFDKKYDKKNNSKYIHIYGEHACKMALLNKHRKKFTLYIIERNKTKYKSVIDVAYKHNVEVKFCKDEHEIPVNQTNTKNLQGIVLKCLALENFNLEYLHNIIKEKDDYKPSLILALDSITDPHNLGAILRSCAAFSYVVDAIITSKINSPRETESIAKVSSGGIEIIPWITVSNIKYAITSLKKDFFYSCYGVENYGSASLHEISFNSKSILLFGSEGKGIQKILLDYCDATVNIPTLSSFSSLNVSNAAAILAYEFSRQKSNDLKKCIIS